MSYRHLSIRVPWHDTGWDGRVCAAPRLNGACLKLNRIASSRDDAAEEAVAGMPLNQLDPSRFPPCAAERMGFMAPFEYSRVVEHPYNRGPHTPHGHFEPTTLRHPPYSAAAVPFSWLLRDAMQIHAQEHELDVQPEREPNLGFQTNWVQDYQNQTALLDCFADHLQPEKSLCFFYAKQVPFVEDTGGNRILVGVGRVSHIGSLQEYEYNTNNLNGKLRSMLWERMVQHSIRPDFEDGFLLPYHAALERAAEDPGFDPAELAALAPADRMLEFSHASQHVSHDGAIASLLACAESLRKAEEVLPGPWNHCLEWIDARLEELWQARGPCPGLGAALSAFGLDQSTFVARAVADQAGENADPWPWVDQMFENPPAVLPPPLAHSIGEMLQASWQHLPDERRALLKLVSRFEITREQATQLYVQEERAAAGIDIEDQTILANPYLLYELTRLTNDPVSVWTVDRGVFPDDVIRNQHPLPAPTGLDGGTDARRVRALSVKVLEDAAAAGSTLLPQSQVVLGIRGLTLDPACNVNGDLMEVARDHFEDAIVTTEMADHAPALQLGRLAEMSDTIRAAVERRLNGRPHAIEADWGGLLNAYLHANDFPMPPPADDDFESEQRAREEKTAALQVLAKARIAVLIGPAGTGKTTLLSVFCAQPEIAEGGILLLAPTGKARVRLEQAAEGLNFRGSTIAQFLTPHRYDGATGRYRLSNEPAEAGANTVIIDEASMLTEEMLGALIQALRGVQRLILIGDPRQLPPIGAGRPFVDIVKRLAPENIVERFPRVAPSYAELTIRRRQAGENREDLQLAEWFSGSPIAAGEDNVFNNLFENNNNQYVRFVQWDTPEALRNRVIEVLVQELRRPDGLLALEGAEDIAGFDSTLGGTAWNDRRFFNPRWGDNPGAAEAAEAWQILSPVRSGAQGVSDLNRLIHKQFRQPMIDASRMEGNLRRYPKPMGGEQIVYGDKVINVVNTNPSLPWNRHRHVFPPKDDAYIANGEIGMAVGYYWRWGHQQNGLDFRWKLEVEFSSQPCFKYDFTAKDFVEEGSAFLELAYALTVHKAQGSEFGIVILVLPNPCRLLSRELLYTALTRHKDRVVILHQGNRSDLLKFSSGDRSETARRLTNLFVAPSPIEHEGRFFEKNLIHRTTQGEMVRSKSEVIIANALYANQVNYRYEHPLTIDGVTKYPDFTIEDRESGQTFYWEHCGMLHVPSYRQRWEEKLTWYRSHHILPHEEQEDENAEQMVTLIVTYDGVNGGIDAEKINIIIDTLLN